MRESTSPPCQLTYNLENANVDINTAATLNMTFNYNKPVRKFVYLQTLKIQIPIGTAAMDLTNDIGSVTVTIEPSTPWQGNVDKSLGIISITSTSGTPPLIAQKAFAVKLSGIQVNQEVGACTLNITEIAQANDDEKYYPDKATVTAFTTLEAKKYFQDFYLGNFRVNHPEIASGDSVQLFWEVQRTAGCKLSLSWPAVSANPVDVTNLDTYPADPKKNPLTLFNETTFTLQATVLSHSATMEFPQQLTVSVIKPYIQYFSAEEDSVFLGDPLIFKWGTTEGVSYCALKRNGEDLPTYNHLPPNDKATIPIDKAGTYTLVAFYENNQICDMKDSPTIFIYHVNQNEIKPFTFYDYYPRKTAINLSLNEDNSILTVLRTWTAGKMGPQIRNYQETCVINTIDDKITVDNITSQAIMGGDFTPISSITNVIAPAVNNSVPSNLVTYKIENNTVQVISTKSNKVVSTVSLNQPIIASCVLKNSIKAYVGTFDGIWSVQYSRVQDTPTPTLSRVRPSFIHPSLLSNAVQLKTLYVPMQIQAWVVNNAVMSAQINHPERVIRRWESNFNALKDFDSADISPFSGEAEDFIKNDKNKGVYLHWTLPSGLRHGTQTKSGDPIVYPLVPNRWLVVRYFGPIEKRQVATWIIESDFIDTQQGTSPFPFFAPDKSGPKQTLIGRKITLSAWKETADNKPMFLKAVDNGDITFSAYQPYGENVFSFHDPLFTEEKIEKDTLSYMVAGWYSNISQDPLHDWQTRENFVQLLNRYQWQEIKTTPPVEGAHQLVCHGMVANIPWDVKGDVPPSSQDKIMFKEIQLAIGNTSTEALATLVHHNDPSIPAELLKAFNQGLLNKLEEMDGEGEMVHKNHQLGFGHTPGNTVWTIVKESDSTDTETIFSLTEQQKISLNDLNSKQALFNEQQRILQEKQWELYALWYKRGKAKASGDARLNETQKKIEENLDINNPHSFIGEVKQRNENLTKTKQALDATKEIVIKSLGKNQKLKSLSPNISWHPNDPVVLVTGIQSGWRDESVTAETGRYTGQLITGLHVNSETTITTNQMAALMPDIQLNAIPVEIKGLLQESFLLDPANIAVIAKNTHVAEATLNSLLTNPHAENFEGYLPIYGLQPWRQPWFPLFLEWEIEWYPIPFDFWQFNGERYVIQKNTGLDKIQAKTYAGRTLLLPQSSFSFKSHLSQLFHDDPTLKTQLPNWQALLAEIQDWDVLSQSLSGLYQQLVQRDTRMGRIPMANSNDPLENNVNKLADGQYYLMPIPDPLSGDPFSSPPSSFQATGHGQFYFNRVSIVDRFGQTVNVIQTDTASSYVPIVSEALKPDSQSIVSPISPLRFIQIPPRIIQNAQLNADWVSADSDKAPLTLHVGENPLYGWIVPNYLDQALQVYDREGNNLCEMRVIENEKNTAECAWEPAPSSPYQDLTTFTQHFPALGKMLQALHAIPISAFRAFFDIFDSAFSSMSSQYRQRQPYFAAFAGRPLALARAQWQLILAQPPYKTQNWDKTLDNDDKESSAFLHYFFSLKLGNPKLNQNGLVGYFVGDQWDKFYSVYGNPTINNPYVNPVKDNYLNLSLAESASPVFTTLLFDPYLNIPAYTDILPVVNLVLPGHFTHVLQQMEITFHMGPLLSLRDIISLPSSSEENIYLPKPATETWSWLEKEEREDKQNITWKRCNIKTIGKTAALDVSPEIMEGFLKLDLPKPPPSTQPLTPHANASRSSENKKETFSVGLFTGLRSLSERISQLKESEEMQAFMEEYNEFLYTSCEGNTILIEFPHPDESPTGRTDYTMAVITEALKDLEKYLHTALNNMQNFKGIEITENQLKVRFTNAMIAENFQRQFFEPLGFTLTRGKEDILSNMLNRYEK